MRPGAAASGFELATAEATGRTRWRIAGLAAYGLAYLLWAAFQDPLPRLTPLTASVLTAVGPLVAALLALRSHAVESEAGARRLWWGISLALACWTAGKLVYAVAVASRQPDDPWVGWTMAACYVPYYLVLGWGLLGLARRPLWRGRWPSALDAITVAIGGAILLWWFILGPAAEGSIGALEAFLTGLYYPLGDLAVLLGMALALRDPPPRLRATVRVLDLALVLTLLSDFRYGVEVLSGTTAVGAWSERLSLLASLGFAVAAVVHQRSARQASHAGGAEPVPSLLPYAAAAAGLATLVHASLAPRPAGLMGLAVAATVLLAAVLVRQALALHENTRLRVERQLSRRTEARFRALAEQLAHQAFHDPLTQLANRALLIDRLEQALARARRSGERVVLLFLDIDDFKSFNDRLGHAAGDAILVEVASRIRSDLRETDTAARWGGDEFAVLLEDAASVETGLRAAERVLAALRRPLAVKGHELVLSASLGIAAADEPIQAPDDLLRAADLALYEAKALGKNQWALFRATPEVRAVQREGLARDLSRAIDRAEMEVDYQPIVELAGRRLVGFEALVRWRHPEHGRLGPGQFIGLAEASGHIRRIGQWVLEEACRCAAGWPLDGRDGAPFVSVNVALAQLLQPDLQERLLEIAAAAGLEPGRLVLELEEETVRRRTLALDQVRRLRAAGIRVAIDDFGAGLTALGSLAELPVDLLKLDRGLVAALGERDDAAPLLEGVVRLGLGLGFELIAEGIESAEHAELLAGLGCRLGQGFHLGAPLAAAEAAALAAGRGRPTADVARSAG